MESKTTSTGASGTTLLQIAFIVLKLCNVIDWSWWWVLSPLWITGGLSIMALIGYLIYLWFKYTDEKKRKKSGMSEWEWKYRNKKDKPPEPKSKWQQRMEEMQKKQKSESN